MYFFDNFNLNRFHLKLNGNKISVKEKLTISIISKKTLFKQLGLDFEKEKEETEHDMLKITHVGQPYVGIINVKCVKSSEDANKITHCKICNVQNEYVEYNSNYICYSCRS